ncbi:MAG: hypothetical protein ABI560_09685, partial [Myxococcales bacterium]
MTRGQKSTLLVTVAAAVGTASLLVARPAAAEVILLHQDDGWQLSTDGRVNAFLSMAVGTGIPDEPDALGAGTNDTKDSMKGLHSARVRNGFIPSVLGFTLQREYSPNFKVTARAALWMNISGSRTRNIAGNMDPRELYVKMEGRWGS